METSHCAWLNATSHYYLLLFYCSSSFIILINIIHHIRLHSDLIIWCIIINPQQLYPRRLSLFGLVARIAIEGLGARVAPFVYKNFFFWMLTINLLLVSDIYITILIILLPKREVVWTTPSLKSKQSFFKIRFFFRKKCLIRKVRNHLRILCNYSLFEILTLRGFFREFLLK